MTIGIAGPGRKAPRQKAMVRVIIAAFVGGISLILLGLASDVLVDWLWFSSIGYLPVFLTSIGAKALAFFAVLTATAVILWLNGLLAVRFARQQPIQAFAASAWNPTGSTSSPDLFALMRDRLPWSRVPALGRAAPQDQRKGRQLRRPLSGLGVLSGLRIKPAFDRWRQAFRSTRWSGWSP
jgi:hypothetical protein